MEKVRDLKQEERFQLNKANHFCLPRMVLRTSMLSPHLILTVPWGDTYQYYDHFDEETEVQRC